MIHPYTRLGFVNDVIGYGVFATHFIPKGTVIWVLDDLDRKLEPSYLESLDQLRREKVKKYSWRDGQGKYILPWDIAQFVNHSFKANCMSTPYEFEIAIQDIHPNEQLTADYAFCNEDQPFDCFPEEGVNRTRVMPDDILYFYQEWDQKVSVSMNYFNRVNQPLKHLINPLYLDKIDAIFQGKASMDSVIQCYYSESKFPTLER